MPGQPLGGAGWSAAVFFVVFLALSMAITWWAARRTRSNDDFLAAGGKVTAGQNGFALTGDFLAATGFLGSAGLVALTGFDGWIYSIGAMVGWPLMMFLLAEPLRNLGRYTVSDVLATRLGSRSIRGMSAFASLCFVLMFLVMQLVGSGLLVQLLFGLSYVPAVCITGAIMLAYVLVGGMLATTWVQIIKCALLMVTALVLGVLVLSAYGFDLSALLLAGAARTSPAVLGPGGGVPSPLEFLSLGFSTALGVASFPHVLMRFYTVPDARTARRSLLIASGLIGLNMLIILLIGFGAMAMLGGDAIRAADRGGNMAIPLLAAHLGGTWFLGFVGAVAFATILAAVCGLAITGAAALSHDLWNGVVRAGKAAPQEQLRVARIATVLICVTGVLLALAFEGQNIAFLSGLSSAIAASTNFPALLLAVFWPRLTTAGALTGMVVGLVSTVSLLIFSPLVQMDMLHHATALFPLRNPGIVSIPLAFATTVLVSLAGSRARSQSDYDAVERQMLLGRDYA
jgi:cation/acetate symporter